MSFIQNIGKRLGLIRKSQLELKKDSIQRPMPENVNKKGLVYKLKKYSRGRIDLEIKIWKTAVTLAEDPIRPRRVDLYDLYHEAMNDDHLLSQVRTARFTVQMSDFKIEKDGKEDESLKELFTKPWFFEYLQHAVDAELYGHSLIEFNPKMEEGQFSQINLVDRNHVRPEYGEVVIFEHDEKGLPYRDGPLSKYALEIGKAFDLGLLKVASKVVIRKEYALGDWSRRNERYGQPMLIIKTASTQKDEIDTKAAMAENIGSSGWAILDDEDDVQLKESTQAFTYQTFNDYAKRCDQGLSILINGQTGTTQEKAYVGSAEVHERILNTYTKARLQRIQNHTNERLIPFLIGHGYPLQGAKIQFIDLEEREERASTDDMEGGQEVKKKPIRDLVKLAYKNFALSTHIITLNLGGNIDNIIASAIERVFKKRLKAGQVDAKIWKENVSQLWQGVQQGLGSSFAQMEYTDTRYELAAAFRNNIHVFAAFKNHQETQDMVDALLDENGKQRSFSDFKEIALKISSQYNKTWLQAEYNTAIANGQMSVKWQDYQANKDILPNIRYSTAGDDRVRPGHQVLDGTTLPIEDPFWDEFFPPNGWGCRCTTQQTAEGATKAPTSLPDDQSAPLIFRHNPGKTQELYSKDHPYFLAITNKEQRQRVRLRASRLAYDNYDTKDFEKMGFDSKTGAYLVANKARKLDNRKKIDATGKTLKNHSYQVELIADKSGSTPDALINNKLFAFSFVTAANTKDGVKNAIAASKWERLVISLSNTLDVNQLIIGLHSAMMKNTLVSTIIIEAKGKAIEMSRKDILDFKHRDMLQTLK